MKDLNILSKEDKEVEDFRTVVVFYWRNHPISFENAKKVLFGVTKTPDGLTMKIRIMPGSVH